MKHITLIIGLLVVGCGTSADNTTKPTPQMGLTLSEKVVGTYERKKDLKTQRRVLLENGDVEAYFGRKKIDGRKWKIVNGEIYIEDMSGLIFIYRIHKDGSITFFCIHRWIWETADNAKRKPIYLQKNQITLYPTNHSSYTNKAKHNTQTTSAINKLKKLKA